MVLVAGGPSGAAPTAELYHPATGTWSATAVMATARLFYTATLLQNGKVVVAGGFGNLVPNALASAELYSFIAEECKNKQWQNFTLPPGPFKSQGQCTTFF